MRQISVHQLVVDAALTGKKEYIYQAALLDPHASADLTIDEIRNLVDEGYNRCMQILKDNIEKLHIVAKILMKQEKITGEEFAEIMAEDYVYVEKAEVPAVEETSESAENTETVAEIVETANEVITENAETVIEPVVSENTAEAETENKTEE